MKIFKKIILSMIISLSLFVFDPYKLNRLRDYHKIENTK